MEASLVQESLFIPVTAEDTLHLRHIYQTQEGPPVFMLHGAVENGRIFYSDTARGLAPYLARRGFDVYVADQRGRGLSRPPIRRGASYGQTEAITEDLPAFIEAIKKIRGDVPQHWVAHSWGGVLMASFLARSPQYMSGVASMVCFGTKRTIRVRHLKKRLVMDLFWDHVGRLLVKVIGFLPARQLHLGSDNETDKSHLHCKQWVQPQSPWIDPQDGFDYAAAAKRVSYPPTLHLAGIGDAFLGHPRDVHDFLVEMGATEYEYIVLGRRYGNRRDYGHINMLTDPEAEADHFPLVVDWMQSAAK